MKLKLKIITIITILLMLTACTEDEAFLVITRDKEQVKISADSIYNNLNAESFPAVVRSSGEKPVETEYKGIELNVLLAQNNINAADFDKITFNATDGYRTILSIEELNDPKNVYLTFERDGELLKTKKAGGNGPFQLVIRRDPFSQRWVKHVNEIILE